MENASNASHSPNWLSILASLELHLPTVAMEDELLTTSDPNLELSVDSRLVSPPFTGSEALDQYSGHSFDQHQSPSTHASTMTSIGSVPWPSNQSTSMHSSSAQPSSIQAISRTPQNPGHRGFLYSPSTGASQLATWTDSFLNSNLLIDHSADDSIYDSGMAFAGTTNLPAWHVQPEYPMPNPVGHTNVSSNTNQSSSGTSNAGSVQPVTPVLLLPNLENIPRTPRPHQAMTGEMVQVLFWAEVPDSPTDRPASWNFHSEQSKHGTLVFPASNKQLVNLLKSPGSQQSQSIAYFDYDKQKFICQDVTDPIKTKSGQPLLLCNYRIARRLSVDWAVVESLTSYKAEPSSRFTPYKLARPKLPKKRGEYQFRDQPAGDMLNKLAEFEHESKKKGKESVLENFRVKFSGFDLSKTTMNTFRRAAKQLTNDERLLYTTTEAGKRFEEVMDLVKTRQKSNITTQSPEDTPTPTTSASV